MNKHGEAISRKYKIGSAWQIFPMQPKPESQTMGCSANCQLGNRIARPNSSHHLAACLSVDFVSHLCPPSFPAVGPRRHHSQTGRESTTTETVACPSDFAPNRTPAAMRAALIRSTVPLRTAAPPSTLVTVLRPTLASCASRLALHPRPARAMRISTPWPAVVSSRIPILGILHHFFSSAYGKSSCNVLARSDKQELFCLRLSRAPSARSRNRLQHA
jgi:hypothetical protein